MSAENEAKAAEIVCAWRGVMQLRSGSWEIRIRDEIAAALDEASRRAFADAVERCAKVAEEHEARYHNVSLPDRDCPKMIAAAIRSIAPAGKAGTPGCEVCGDTGWEDIGGTALPMLSPVKCRSCAGKADGR